MASKRKGSVSALPPVGAHIAYIQAGFADQPCRVMVNLNCFVNIILGLVKPALLELLESQIRLQTEPPSGEEEALHWKIDYEHLQEVRGELCPLHRLVADEQQTSFRTRKFPILNSLMPQELLVAANK